MQTYLEPLGQHWIGFLPVQCCPKSIRQKLHRIFSYAILSGTLGPYCIGFRPVQCFPKSMKQNCTGFFSHAMLAGASRTTVH